MTTTVNLPKPLVEQALKQAAASARRMANTQTAKYGPEHLMVQTLIEEAKAYETAEVTTAK